MTEYIRGRFQVAAVSLLTHIRESDIKHGPVAQPSRRNPRIVAYGIDPKDFDRVPNEWHGFPVEKRSDGPNYEKVRTAKDVE